MKSFVYLALGSNLGDRMAFLQEAEKQLENHPQISIVKRSSIYETQHWPPSESSEHPDHLNQVIMMETILNPVDLLSLIQVVEKQVGKKKREHWGSREIDIDLLLYDDLRIDSPELTLPHPYMVNRRFVLVPLLELAPHLVDPLSGEAYSAILDRLEDRGSVLRL